MAELDNIASQLLKSASEADKIYSKTRDQSQKDKATRLRVIVQNLRNITLGASDLNGLSDVTISAPANAQVLAYNSSTGQWENQTGGGGGGGDMTKSVYDVDNDGIVDGSETTQIIVRNSTGTTLTKGTVVYLSGATGNRPNAVRAQANTEATSSKTIGIVVANIANNADGFVATNGTLHDLDTSAFTAGDAVWLSAATAGGMTSTIPAEPNHTVFIGYIARAHPTQGRIVILIQNGYELNELHGVLISSEANNDLLVYETSSTLWKNKSISTIFGGTPLVSVPTLDQVTTAGNTTTNAITVGGLNVNGIQLITSADVVNRDVGPAAFSVTNGTFSRFNLVYDAAVARVNILGTSTEGLRIEGGSGASITKIGSGGIVISAPSNNLYLNGGSLLLATGNVERARINSSGNVLIGTTTDAGFKLDVNGTARIQAGLTIANVATYALSVSNGTSSGIGSQYFNAGGILYWGVNNVAGDFLVATNGISYASFFTTTTRALQFGTNQTARMTIFPTTGNVAIGSITDSGAKLQVAGSITAASALAQGVFFNNTLVAAANNDVLVGLDINPTFTNGAFTGVQNVDLRTKNAGVVIGSGYGYGALYGYANDGIVQVVDGGTSSLSGNGYATQIWLRPAGNAGGGNSNYWATIEHSFGGLFIQSARYASNIVIKTGRAGTSGNIYLNNAGGTMAMLFGGTGNVTVGSATDAGYKLDVNGTARVGSLGLYGTNGTTTAPLIRFNGSNQVNVDPQGYGIVTNHTLTTGNYIFASGGGIRSNGSFGAKSSTSVVSTPFISYGISRPDSDASVNPLGGMGGVHDGVSSWAQGLGLVFYTSNGPDITGSGYLTEKMRLSSVGNLGLGTNNPIYPLHISSAAAANIYGTVQSTSASGTAAWVAFNDQSDNVVYRVFGSGASGTQMGIALARSASLMANLGGSGKFLLGTYSNTDFIMGTGNAEKMRIVDSTGNILIATTTDLGNKLEVNGTINATAYKINNVLGYTGILNIPGNPPGQQNIDIQSGIIVNIF